MDDSLLLCFGSRAEETGVFRPLRTTVTNSRNNIMKLQNIRVAVSDSHRGGEPTVVYIRARPLLLPIAARDRAARPAAALACSCLSS
jgi:hypothetical protein